MENYYNNMFHRNASRRGSTTIDRLTDPEVVTNYLCGYSLRICTLYLLWFHLVFNFFVFCTLFLANSYIKLSFETDETPNATLYTVLANRKKIFDIDMYFKGLDMTLNFITDKLAQIVFSWAALDVIVTIMALCGVYLNKLMLMLPYVVPIFTNIVWFTIVLLVEIVGVLTKRLEFSWISISITTFLLIKDSYRFTVLYSYFHMIGKHCFSVAPPTPKYLSTRSPHRFLSPIDTVTTDTTTSATSTPTTALIERTQVSSDLEVQSPKISFSSQTSIKDPEDNG